MWKYQEKVSFRDDMLLTIFMMYLRHTDYAGNVPDYHLLLYTQWSQPFRTMISPNRSSIRSNTQSESGEVSVGYLSHIVVRSVPICPLCAI